MDFRLATEQDNLALLDLCKQAPMEGIVTAYVDQSPNFFTMPMMQGDDFKVWVADNNGSIDGCVVESYKTMRYNGEIKKTFYIGDMKVRPEARGILGLKLSSFVINQAKIKGYSLGECFIIDGNEKMRKVLEWLATKIFTKTDSGYANIYQVMPYRKYNTSKKYTVRIATEKDISQIASILESTYKDYSGAPVFENGGLLQFLSKTETFTIYNFRVAEKDGKIVACAAFWDQDNIRRTVVQQFSKVGKIALFLLKGLKPILGLPKLPKLGDSLKYLFLRFPAIVDNDIEALRAILHHESNQIRVLKRYHFIWASFHQADPLASCISKMWKIKMKVNIFHFKFMEGVDLIPSEKAAEQPVYVDFSLI